MDVMLLPSWNSNHLSGFDTAEASGGRLPKWLETFMKTKKEHEPDFYFITNGCMPLAQ
jgi:hypothetical protein